MVHLGVGIPYVVSIWNPECKPEAERKLEILCSLHKYLGIHGTAAGLLR
jgi:hypothetical protein